jgi:3-oxoisoapionate kinase
MRTLHQIMLNLLLSFYGDDFTGSTDAMESLALAGVATVLFTDPPSAAQLSRYPHIRAFGVAGMTRSMPPDEMERTLRPAFSSLKSAGAPIVHYKVCSTFDSSPTVGSIGRAIDIGADIFGARSVPVVVGAPALGRYCVFGNLFARLGKSGEIHRLDRHPSMSRHPVTPMEEADLRVHLAKQTNKSIGLLDITDLSAGAFERISREHAIMLIDLLDESQLAIVGQLLAAHGGPFIAGSSGVESCLTTYWQKTGAISIAKAFPNPGESSPLLVVSGSCSPVTAGQIRYALGTGFEQVIVSSDRLSAEQAIASASRLLGEHRSVILHTGSVALSAPNHIGKSLGQILRRILEKNRVRRIAIAGGDTSGDIARALRIESVEMIAELTRGAPLCRAAAPGSPADGLEITFKGGQIGKEDFFQTVRMGRHE